MLSDYALAVEALEQRGIRVDVRVEGEPYLEESGQFLRQDCTIRFTIYNGRVKVLPSTFTIINGKLDYSHLAYQLEILGDMLYRQKITFALENLNDMHPYLGYESMPDKGDFLWE